MHDAKNNDLLAFDPVEDDELAHGKAAESRAQIVALPTNYDRP